jgi:hypothetical protein
MKQLVLESVALGTVDLRFDLGTVRILKELTGADAIKGDTVTEDDNEAAAAKIYLAAHLRAVQLRKDKPVHSNGDVLEAFYELDLKTVIKVVNAFNSVTALEEKEGETDAAEGEVKNG